MAAIVMLLSAVGTAPVHAAHIVGYCDTGIPADENLGFVAFPRGDLFCPLLADPKRVGSFASYVRGRSSSAFGTDLGSVGVGDRLGLARWNGPIVGEGVQISLEGGIFAQFDLNTKSYDLINADYVVGLPVTFRRDRVSGRVRLYHQSSHLGDEYLLRPGSQRENFAFEAFESMLSLDVGPLRTYGGGEYLFNRQPERELTWVAHGGVELRQPGGLAATGQLSRIRLVAAMDIKAVEELDWNVAWSVRAGFEIGREPGAEHRSRHWSLMAEYYDGGSPYGQFFREQVSYYGVGLHVGL